MLVPVGKGYNFCVYEIIALTYNLYHYVLVCAVVICIQLNCILTFRIQDRPNIDLEITEQNEDKQNR